MKKHKLSWVDEFIGRIKPYVYMRLSDNVLIRMPNEAFKLNTTAARVIDHILKGGRCRISGRARIHRYPQQQFSPTSPACGTTKFASTMHARIHKTESPLVYQAANLSEIALTNTKHQMQVLLRKPSGKDEEATGYSGKENIG